MSKDYILQIKVRNGPLLTAMREEGFDTAASLARAAGVDQQKIGLYLGLKISATLKDGSWRPTLLRIADALHRLPEDLFPPQHVHEALDVGRGEVAANLEEMRLMIGGTMEESLDPEALMMGKDRTRLIEDALSKLTPRDTDILRQRFGLGDEEPQSLENIARMNNVTTERIRQIEARALRRLKHPSKTRALREAGYVPGPARDDKRIADSEGAA